METRKNSGRDVKNEKKKRHKDTKTQRKTLAEICDIGGFLEKLIKS
jgi:hypothetical protein